MCKLLSFGIKKFTTLGRRLYTDAARKKMKCNWDVKIYEGKSGGPLLNIASKRGPIRFQFKEASLVRRWQSVSWVENYLWIGYDFTLGN